MAFFNVNAIIGISFFIFIAGDVAAMKIYKSGSAAHKIHTYFTKLMAPY